MLKHFRKFFNKKEITEYPVPQMNVERIGAFVSLPKNASKSVLKILELGENREFETTNSPVIFENHQRLVELNKRFDLSSLFVFAFVRNPFDRCVSWFEYHRNLEPYSKLTFEEWVLLGMPHHWKKVGCTNYLKSQITPLSQHVFLTGGKIDFIGKIESFENDMFFITSRLNEQCAIRNLPITFHSQNIQQNRSSRDQDYTRYYTPRTRDKVIDLLEIDFERFGYSLSL